MVARLVFSFLVLPLLIMAGEFTATVSRNQVGLGEGITLTLTLKDASAKANPSIMPLLKTFHLNSQQQFSNTNIINGKMSSSTSWKYILIPQNEGEIIIPSLSIETSEGILDSRPITIHVVKGQSADGEPSNAELATVTTHASKENPYKNEPIFFTVRLSSKQPLIDLRIDKFAIEDAIVEMEGNPKVSEAIEDGTRVGIIEFNYIITPLKAGSIKIPSVVVQGGIPLRRKAFGRSFFDNDFDPFSLIQGYDHLKPFALSTQEIALEVQPPVADVNPWLPARSVTIEEIWDSSQKIQEGEFFTRGFRISAEGANSSQLSALGELQASDKRFKIYADKPEASDETAGRLVKSSRKEQYTIIPQQSGRITLPEIAVSWWNVDTNQKEVARVPARALDVLPAEQVAMNARLVKDAGEEATAREALSVETAVINPLLYAAIGVLAILLLVAVVWAVTIQKRMNRLLKPAAAATKPVVKPVVVRKDSDYAPKSKHEKLTDLNPT
jgi:hypothetical protein